MEYKSIRYVVLACFVAISCKKSVSENIQEPINLRYEF